MDKPVIITIAGGSGSGKTTVAQKIMNKFRGQNIILIKLDDYYKRLDDMTYEERTKVNYDHPNSIDFDLFYYQLNSLVNGIGVDKPTYDFTIHNRSEIIEHINPANIILIEGILVLQDERIRNLSDIKVYVDTDSDLRFIRRLKRDTEERGRSVESVINQYLSTVRPMHEAFVERTKKYADVIIPNDKNHNVAVSLIESKIGEILKR